MQPFTYKLELTDSEVDALYWIGSRYAYSEFLVEILGDRSQFDVSRFLSMTESQAWDWAYVVMASRPRFFPLAGQELSSKLLKLFYSIV